MKIPVHVQYIYIHIHMYKCLDMCVYLRPHTGKQAAFALCAQRLQQKSMASLKQPQQCIHIVQRHHGCAIHVRQHLHEGTRRYITHADLVKYQRERESVCVCVCAMYKQIQHEALSLEVSCTYVL